MIGILESHLHIQTDEFSHVAVSQTLFGTENGAYLEDSTKVRH